MLHLHTEAETYTLSPASFRVKREKAVVVDYKCPLAALFLGYWANLENRTWNQIFNWGEINRETTTHTHTHTRK